ncbi:hypothetical protein PPYR_13892 [Photinus pyralis]|uniref:Uncharacterized protein n=1 Tax=Photinus pyralis TaxID=7054 RepID=A0A5N4AAC2_PHOPY|nr:hypothetical protein PPYR_13892 [Photinus pyralis]
MAYWGETRYFVGVNQQNQMGNRLTDTMPSLHTVNDDCLFNGVAMVIDGKSLGEGIEEDVDEVNNSKLLNNVRIGKTEDATVINNQVHVQLVYPSEVAKQQVEVAHNFSVSNEDMKIINIYPTLAHNDINIDWRTCNFPVQYAISPFNSVFYSPNGCLPQSNCITLNGTISNGTLDFENTSRQTTTTTREEITPPLSILKTEDTELPPGSCDEDVVFVEQYQIKSPKKCKTKLDPVLPRKVTLPERKNPARKTQMDKASIKLAQNLSIPPSVFNARSRRNSRRAVPIRQSNRTTGAILNPPSPLREDDYREWPVDGLHETSWYNEKTSTIEYVNGGTKKAIRATKRSKKFVRYSQDVERKQHNNQLGIIAHKNLHLVLDYVTEVKQFRTILNQKDNLTEEDSENDALSNLTTLLYDTCDLYSLLNNTNTSSLANYIRSLSKN